MIESNFISPWNDESEERIASTLDLRTELALVQQGTFDEYSLCFEAALDKDRPLSDRERYLMARYGHEYATNPEKFHQNLDSIEAGMSNKVGEFVLIQNSPTCVFIDKLSSANLFYDTRVTHAPYASISIETSSSIGTIVDKDFKIVPGLTRDFVAVGVVYRMIAEGTTRLNWIRDKEQDKLVMDPNNNSSHEGDEWDVRFGLEEIRTWQRDNLKWARHVDNMMSAWNTQLINIAAAKAKENYFEGNSIDVMRMRGQDVTELERLLAMEE